MATRIDELYEQDFYVWTQRQAEALRRLAETRPNVELDFPHLIEEVEDLGTSQRDAVRSRVRRIIEHCLKLRVLPVRTGRLSSMEPVQELGYEAGSSIARRRNRSRQLVDSVSDLVAGLFDVIAHALCSVASAQEQGR